MNYIWTNVYKPYESVDIEKLFECLTTLKNEIMKFREISIENYTKTNQ